jgi:hypothetical protein
MTAVAISIIPSPSRPIALMICSMMPSAATGGLLRQRFDLGGLVGQFPGAVGLHREFFDRFRQLFGSLTESTLVCALMTMPAVDCDLSRVCAAINDLASAFLCIAPTASVRAPRSRRHVKAR